MEVGSEVTGKFVNEFALPSAVIINKIDNEHSNFKRTLQQAKERLSSGSIVISFPANEGVNFKTVIDVLKMKAYTYGDPGSKKYPNPKFPPNLNLPLKLIVLS